MELSSGMQNHGLGTVTTFEQIVLPKTPLPHNLFGGLSQSAKIFGIFNKKPHLVSVVHERQKLVL